MDQLVLKRAAASPLSGEWSDDDYDVLCEGAVVGGMARQGTFSPGRPTSRNLLETAEGFDADSDCGRGRTEQGHLQKSLKRPGVISVYLTVCWMFLWPR